MCTFPASVSNRSIEGWRLLSQVLVQSMFTTIQVNLFCNSNGGSLQRFCRSPFHKFWRTELSSHPFSVNASLSAMSSKNMLYRISMLQCWLNIALNWLGHCHVQFQYSQPCCLTKSRHGEYVFKEAYPGPEDVALLGICVWSCSFSLMESAFLLL